MTTNAKFSLIVVLVCSISLIAGWFLVTSVPEYLREKNTVAQTDFDFNLRANPEDIIFSQAYKDAKGRNTIKYAYLGRDVSTVEGEDVIRRTPSSQTFILEQFENEGGKPMEKLKTVFTAGPQYFKDETGWRQIEYATTTQEIFSKSDAISHIKRRELAERVLHKLFGIKPVFAAVSTFYPNPDVEITSVDGDIYSVSTGNALGLDAWNNARSGAGTINVYDATVTNAVEARISIVPRTGLYIGVIDRSFLLFDTSSLTAGATISSATLSIYITSITNGHNSGNDSLNIITTTPASNTALAAGDWGSVGSVLQASAVDLSALTATAYNNFSLNSTGLGNISKSGVTKFGIRPGEDIANVRPSDDTGNQVVFSSAEQTGTSQDPKLEVTYTVSTFSMGGWFPF